MKTIQEHFREADVDELVNTYLFEYPLSINPADELDSTTPAAKIYANYEAKVRSLIERIKTTKPADVTIEHVFFVRHCTERNGDDIETALMRQDDLLDASKHDRLSYGYEFSPLAETLATPVADTYLTMRNITTVLVDYLHETSFFGYEQEGLQDAIDRLNEALEHSDEHPEDLRPLEDLYDDIGYEPEVRDEAEKAAWLSYIKAAGEYNMTASRIEEEKVAQLLREQKGAAS